MRLTAKMVAEGVKLNFEATSEQIAAIDARLSRVERAHGLAPRVARVTGRRGDFIEQWPVWAQKWRVWREEHHGIERVTRRTLAAVIGVLPTRVARWTTNTWFPSPVSKGRVALGINREAYHYDVRDFDAMFTLEAPYQTVVP